MPYFNCIYQKIENSYILNFIKLNYYNPYIKLGISYNNYNLSIVISIFFFYINYFIGFTNIILAKKIINKKYYLKYKKEATKDKLISL